ncbi:TPA: helix-turn-helix transcriptional regulator [Clostridioides difficile]|uniref:helix-turn-helix domain-containing protein n=1 Tax=Clostridioides difficile TaxID=1496 RepID=UPI00038D2C11|nr:helix-turn-helix transcriptional regulator [Clostridioides difficile]AXU54397.1 phage regulatory protein [Clostridioides difficile]EQH02658.1 helix-turn-helix family protein [Clostridioides difficile DA00196]EQI49527.1 helix-turn-helix family protein [Clostridioides difficile Y270]EQJ89996.1 helix-turn-helix family protein [Clostridioides difficile P50]MCP6803381.1 helix-turn-helix domain-containing protein [Clostridioides difficile]
MDFGDRIKQLRENMNLSREELSNKINISYSALSKYETNNRFPDKVTLNKIADFFDVSTDYLLGRNKNISNEEDKEVKELVDIIYKLDKEDRDAVLKILDSLISKHK